MHNFLENMLTIRDSPQIYIKLFKLNYFEKLINYFHIYYITFW